MNFYEHHLGDYLRDTAHLSMLEDAAYRRLLDVYYVRERPLPLDTKQCCKLARALSPAEREAVELVLAEFFILTDDGYHQARADGEIARYRHKRDLAKASAQVSVEVRAKRTHSERTASVERPLSERTADAEPTLSGRRALQSPVPSPQSPEELRPALSAGKSSQDSGEDGRKGRRIDPDLQLTSEWSEVAQRYGLAPARTFLMFKNHFMAKSGRDACKLEWLPVWENWCLTAAQSIPGRSSGSVRSDVPTVSTPIVRAGKVLTPEDLRRLKPEIAPGQPRFASKVPRAP